MKFKLHKSAEKYFNKLEGNMQERIKEMISVFCYGDVFTAEEVQQIMEHKNSPQSDYVDFVL